MMTTQKEMQTTPLWETLNIPHDTDKHVVTHISTIKQPGLSVSALNTIIENYHVTEDNVNQRGIYQIIF
jgi:hypothetical protein